jgi:multidrug resistance efflux pump
MAMSMSIKFIIGSRHVRIGLALGLIAVSVWAFAPFLTYRISSSAFLNAEIRRVTAPIAGHLSDELPPKGQYIPQPSKLMLIKSYTIDRRRLLDLERQLAEANEKTKLASQQLAEIAALDRELEQRLGVHREGVTKRLGHEISEASAEKIGCFAEVQHRRDISQLMKGLVQAGNTSHIRSAEASALQQAIATKCEMASVRLERLKAELSSVAKGVFVRDAVNDVPYSQQQRERLFVRRQELEMVAHHERARPTQLALEIAEERRRLEQLGQYSVTLPADHVVWAVPASPGSAVTEGQMVLDLVDCNHRFVAVELPEREFEQIKPNDPASVRLIGSTRWLVGTVRQVRGSAARGDDRLLAAHVPAPTSGHITVEVALPDDDPIATVGRGYCGIGRLAEVRFQRARPAFLERAERFLWSFFQGWPPPDELARQ